MNKRTKGYLIISYLIYPFAGVLYSLFNFENKTARNLLVYFGFAFLGFIALEEGDLERYASNYYLKQHTSFIELINDLFSLNSGKFIVDIIATLTSFINNHHFYFAFLYIIFGFYLLNTIRVFIIKPFRYNSFYGKIFILSFLLYFTIRSSINFAFYCGAIFYLYYLTKYIFLNENKKYLLLSCLAPLFHIGLAPLLIANLFFYGFRKNSYPLIIFVMLSFGVSQIQVISVVGTLLTEQVDSSMLDSKYRSYASEAGQERLNKRYEEGSQNYNIKLKILNLTRELIQYILLPLSIILIWFKRKNLLKDKVALLLFNAALATWIISNLMLNISQGERFLVVHTFLILGLCVYLYQTIKLPLFIRRYFFMMTPFLLIYGIGSLYASNKLISASFFVSNFFIEFFSNT